VGHTHCLCEIGGRVGEWRLYRSFHWSGEHGGSGASVANPDEDTIVLIPSDLVRIEEFVLEGLQGVVVQVKLHFERAIRHPAPLAQERDHLVHHRDKAFSRRT
jgi:hypothetical protein